MTVISASHRFNKIAGNYAKSEVHSSSASMRLLYELVPEDKGLDICDIACGAGHLGLSFADRANRLVFVDPAPRMLDTVRELACDRGLAVETVASTAENIPLDSESFDLAVSRLAPHHFRDPARAINEMTRIVRLGGHVSVVDLEGHTDPVIDAFNHELEVLHDPTHVRSYTTEEWRDLFAEAGLEIVAVHPRMRESSKGVTVKRWCEIAGSGHTAETRIRERLSTASQATLDALEIGFDGNDFLIPVRTVLVLGRKAV